MKPNDMPLFNVGQLEWLISVTKDPILKLRFMKELVLLVEFIKHET